MKLPVFEMKTPEKRAGGRVVYGLYQRSVKRFIRAFFQLLIYSINASVAMFYKGVKIV